MALNTRKPALGAAKVVGQAGAVSADLVDTATLIRGRVYSMRWGGESYHFEHGVETVLETKDGKPLTGMVNELEELHAEIKDADGDAFEKPLFQVRKQVPRPVKGGARDEPRRNIVRLPPRPLQRPTR